MKHYFLLITIYIAKNKAHARLQEHVKNYDQKVVDENNLEEIIDNIKIITNAVNEAFPRCQDIVLHTHRYPEFGLLGVSVDASFYLNVTLVKGFMIDEPINVQ
jgi:hypothetical protein